MLLKYQLIDINKLILKFYKKLGLTDLEAMVLIQLFSMLDKSTKFQLSYVLLKGKTNLGSKEIRDLIFSLTNKGFIEIMLEKSKNGKEAEMVYLNKAIEKFEALMLEAQAEDAKKEIEQLAKDYIDLFEKELGRILTPSENNIVVRDLVNYNMAEVEGAILYVTMNKKLTVKAVVDYLNAKKVIDEKVDEKDEEAIIGFYNSISKKPR